MSDIHIERRHALGIERARGVAQKWMAHVEREHGLACTYTRNAAGTGCDVARFTRPGQVACMAPAGPGDPNADTLRAVERQLRGVADARGERLDVVTLPSPGTVVDRRGELVAPRSLAIYDAVGRRLAARDALR